MNRPPKQSLYVSILIFTLFVTLSGATFAQQPPTISTKVNAVSILTTVHDPDGHVVKNLTSDDFVLTEDGNPRKIDYFAAESGLPLTVGLLVDTSFSQRHVLQAERRASDKFLKQVLREDKDQGFVVSFDVRVDTLQGVTSSHSELEASLKQLRVPHEFGTLIFTAIHETSENLMRKQSGRKAFILLTDGVAFRDQDNIETAIEFAQRADAIIFPIRFSDNTAPYHPLRAAIMASRKEHGIEGLRRMATETGGVYYEVSKDKPLEEIYSEIEDLLRSQYVLGYTPPQSDPDGKYHKIKVTTNDRRLVVHARDGYYAK
jgi:VWFA-related protein